MKINKYISLIFGFSCGLAIADSSDFQNRTRTFDNTPVMGAQVSPPLQMTLAERKLEKIVSEQNAFLSELLAHPDRFTENEEIRRFDEIIKLYDAFLAENPSNVYAHILYGKLLRSAGFIEEANNVFMTANKKDPNVAVIKQQIGNYLAEKGQFALALPYFLSAIEIEPKTAIYHYQLGELLSTFKESFITSKILTPEQFDAQLLNAFYQAWKISPSWTYQVRYAEAFYDIERPRWAEALGLWKDLEGSSPTTKEKELVFLNEARVLIKLEKYEEAKALLAKVYVPEFEKSRRELLESIPTFNK